MRGKTDYGIMIFADKVRAGVSGLVVAAVQAAAAPVYNCISTCSACCNNSELALVIVIVLTRTITRQTCGFVCLCVPWGMAEPIMRGEEGNHYIVWQKGCLDF